MLQRNSSRIQRTRINTTIATRGHYNCAKAFKWFFGPIALLFLATPASSDPLIFPVESFSLNASSVPFIFNGVPVETGSYLLTPLIDGDLKLLTFELIGGGTISDGSVFDGVSYSNIESASVSAKIDCKLPVNSTRPECTGV